jgi:hypothetical protein
MNASRNAFLAVGTIVAACALFATTSRTQELISVSLLQVTTMLSSPPPMEAQEELPGMGHKFELFGSANDAKDPDNPTNDVISTVLSLASEATFSGGAIRRLPPGIKIGALDNQVNLKYRFTSPRTCFGGSPRITLFIDTNGDGSSDLFAQGHVNPPFFAACDQDEWRIEDLSDNLKRWETTGTPTPVPPAPPPPAPPVPVCGPIGALTTCTWDELEMRITALFPFHQVVAGGLIDDTFGAPGQTGTAHYDLITIENRTLENDQDTVKDGK